MTPAAGAAVGARIAKIDGVAKLTGSERFGADAATRRCALAARGALAPCPRALSHRAARAPPAPLSRPGSGADRRGRARQNRFGIYPHIKDQPVLAEGQVRFRGEAVLALVGDGATIARLPTRSCRSRWEPEAAGHRHRRGDGAGCYRRFTRLTPDNVLMRGLVRQGRCGGGVRRGRGGGRRHASRPAFVEHAYIEPEAGYARRVGEHGLEDRIVRLHPDALHGSRRGRAVLRLRARAQVRIVPTACGGGFGGKLDLSVQPLIATRRLEARAARCAASTRGRNRWRATTKRHPAQDHGALCLRRRRAADAVEFHGDFNTGAYASWGPTVANRVPVHATGPYVVPECARDDAGDLHQRAARRRLPRLRRAAGGDRARGADGRAGRAARHRSAGVPPHECAPRRRRHGDRAGARGERRAAAMPRSAARRTGARRARRAGAPSIAKGGARAARRRHRLHVVRHRQHLDVQPLDHARRAVDARAGSRSTTARSISARARTPSWCRSAPMRWASPVAASSRSSPATPTSRPMPARPRPRARPSSPAMRRKLAGEDLRAQAPAPRQCRAPARR